MQDSAATANMLEIQQNPKTDSNSGSAGSSAQQLAYWVPVRRNLSSEPP